LRGSDGAVSAHRPPLRAQTTLAVQRPTLCHSPAGTLARLGRLACLLLVVSLSACTFRPYVPDQIDPRHTADEIATARLDAAELADQVRQLDRSTGWPPTVWTPAELGLVGALRSPLVRHAQAEERAARAAATLAVQRQNPLFSLGLERHSLVDDNQTGKWGIGPSFSLMLAPPGRRALISARAEVEVTRARLALLAAAWSARESAAKAALVLLASRELAASEARANVARTETLAVARASVAAGVADPFEWQTLLLTANDARLARLARLTETARAEAALAAALLIPVAELRELPLQPSGAAAVPEFEQLQEHMLKNDPAVLAALADFDAADRDLALAVHAQYPSVQLEPGYFFSQGDHVWSLLGGVVVPVFASQDAAIASAEAKRVAAREHVHAVQAGAIGTLREAFAQWQSTREMQAEARAIAADIRRHHEELLAKAAEGIVDRLTVSRAAQQLAEMGVQLELARNAERAARFSLESIARIPGADPTFIRYLEQLQAPDDDQPDA